VDEPARDHDLVAPALVDPPDAPLGALAGAPAGGEEPSGEAERREAREAEETSKPPGWCSG
jgi:hypothetical protein